MLGLGERTFARIVEDSVGLTGKLWLRQLRAVTACHMLREGRKIKELTQELGYRYDPDFTRDFKKTVGVTPADFMKSELARSGMGKIGGRL